MFCGPSNRHVISPNPIPVPVVAGLDNPTATAYSNGASSSANNSKLLIIGTSANCSTDDNTSASPSPRAKLWAASSGRGNVAISEHRIPTTIIPPRAPSHPVSIHISPATISAQYARMAFIDARVKSRCKGLAWPRKTLLALRPLWITSLISRIVSSC
ncbi:hypothetical protein D3C84_938060 [compost metagenome]